MRYSRMQYENTRAQQRSFKGIWLFVVIIAAVVGIYLIGAAKVGDFLSQKIVTPVVSWLTGEKPQQEPSDSANTAVVPSNSPSSAAEETVSKDLKMEGGTIYALQVGLYAEEKNAQDASAQLVSKGGAGYILQTQEGMRVLIAGYATREDAENVQQRLASEQQMETSIYEMSTQALIVSVSVDADTIAKVEFAIANTNKYYNDLLGAAISFDKQELSKDALQQNIASLKAETASIRSDLQNLQATENNVIQSLATYYQKVENALAKAEGDLSDAALSSQIKSVYLEIGDAKMELVQNLQN